MFQPLLYQVATATLSPGDIASPIRWILRRYRNIRELMGDVARRTIREEFRNIVTSRTRIVLVDAGPSVLAAFPEPLQDVARQSLQRLGVEVVERTQVTAIDAGGVRPGDHYLPAGTIVWAAGVAASPLVATLGTPLDRAGRAIVEPDLSIPGHPEVFVQWAVAYVTRQRSVRLIMGPRG